MLRSMLTVATPLAALVASIASWPTVPADGVRITGRISALESGDGLPGARVDALEDGVFGAASVLTDEDGRYELTVEPGRYDLRVLAAEPGYLAGFERALDLTGGETHRADFSLVEAERELRAVGIEPDHLTDTDGDLVPDVFERATRLDPEQVDTSEDGVSDGLAGWVGADPRTGPLRTESAPHVSWPPAGAEIPLIGAATPPVGLHFDHVPGATGYRLTVYSGSGKVLHAEDFSATDGELCLGEGGALRWTPPASLPAEELELRLQGWYDDPEEEVGRESALRLRFFEVEEIEPIEIEDEEVRWSGLVVASTVRLGAGAKVIVPSGETLTLVATEGLVIEWDAALIGEPGEPGASIVICTPGNVVVFGPVVGGDGAPGPDEEALGQGPARATAGDGARGGDVEVFARAAVTIGPEGLLQSGYGGDGGRARAEAIPAEDALAVGGTGGAGGRLTISAAAIVVADRPGRIEVGGGGRGGDAEARGGDGQSDRQAGLSSALPGVGGDAGDVWLSDWNLRRDGFVALADESFPVQGGLAGAPGEAQLTYGAAGTPSSRSREGRAHEVLCGVHGGRGWRVGGEGQPAIARGGEGFGTGAGGTGTALGGPGGRVSYLGTTFGDLRLTFAFVPRGGTGGVARATGGVPGAGGKRNPGRGGGAHAHGGDGGPGFATQVAQMSRGGDGGDADARGLDGVNGAGRCPNRGQDGSDGGAAEALGGKAGDANFAGGNGGGAAAVAGSGGNGGQGDPGGRGGRRGGARAVGGERGLGLVFDGVAGTTSSNGGGDGARGPRCPN